MVTIPTKLGKSPSFVKSPSCLKHISLEALDVLLTRAAWVVFDLNVKVKLVLRLLFKGHLSSAVYEE